MESRIEEKNVKLDMESVYQTVRADMNSISQALGISARDVTYDMAQRQGWPQGVQVMSTQVGSGAEIAGLQQGYIIFMADRKDVKSFDDLTEIKDSHKPGEIYKIMDTPQTTINENMMRL